MSASAKRPVLSLILCSRNDAYMGNSRWRLETTLNYVGDRVQALGREDDVEVIVADWGSGIPLADVVSLGPSAARIVSFLHVPPAVARALQQDSPFPEVMALNAAARRARGQYIGRIDQDTLAGERFLRWMFDAAASGLAGPEGPALPRTLLFANRRSIPYRFAVLCPRLDVVERFVSWFGDRLRIETGRVFYNIDVGIWLVHRDLWNECGGYDERMIYMNDMDIDMVNRLKSKFPLIDLGKVIAYDFYHLDHYHPRGSRSSSTHRKVNSQRPLPPLGFRPSGEEWGLAAHQFQFELTPSMAPDAGRRVTAGQSLEAVPVILAALGLSLYTAVRVGVDRLIYPFYPVWKRRAAIAWATIHVEPVLRWPWLLRKLWLERPSANGVVMR